MYCWHGNSTQYKKNHRFRHFKKCTITNNSCYKYEKKIKSWLPSLTWLLPLLGPGLLICLSSLFSSRLETVKLQMVMEAKPHMQETSSWYHGPLERPPPTLQKGLNWLFRGSSRQRPLSWQKSGLPLVKADYKGTNVKKKNNKNVNKNINVKGQITKVTLL
jgi:hypothetical protein